MKKNMKVKVLLFFAFLFCYIPQMYANIIWPAAIVASGILTFSSLLLVIISIAIEAILFYLFIKNVSYAKAILMSVIGNAASTLVGTILMAFAMVGWHFIFDPFLGGTFNIYNVVATWVLMYLGSGLIELLTIKLIFRYPFKELLLPVFIGNLITYVLVAIYQFPTELTELLDLIQAITNR